MDDFKTRLIEERKQLSEKTNKLNEFMYMPKFNDIPNSQQVLLKIQLCAMKTYLQVITERIKLIEE